MSLRPSEYNILEIQGQDNRTIDIRVPTISFDYYEDVLVPTVSVKLVILNAGGQVENEKGRKVDLYSGLGLRGGEAVRIRITPAGTVDTETIDFTNIPLYVNSVSDLYQDSQKQYFTIHLLSREAIQNEVSFVQRAFKKEQTIAQHATSILKQDLKSLSPINVEPTGAPNLGFVGNQMSPFECLMLLASKAVGSASGSQKSSTSGASSGFFFYQTRDGYQFRSVDGLVSQKPKARYYYSEFNQSSLTAGDEANQYRINFYEILRNQDIVDELQKGAYSSERRFFNPLDFKVQSPNTGSVFTGNDYITEGVKNLGEGFNKLKLVDAQFAFTDVASLIITETIDIGTLDTGVVFQENQDKNSYISQSRMRYNTLFTQIVSLQVPLNTSLRAGDTIQATFPTGKTGDARADTEGQITGKYIVKEICHHTDPRGSYTSMVVIRDTFGSSNDNGGGSVAAPSISNPVPAINLLSGAFGQ
jgi:hypothetical protein